SDGDRLPDSARPSNRIGAKVPVGYRFDCRGPGNSQLAHPCAWIGRLVESLDCFCPDLRAGGRCDFRNIPAEQDIQPPVAARTGAVELAAAPARTAPWCFDHRGYGSARIALG